MYLCDIIPKNILNELFHEFKYDIQMGIDIGIKRIAVISIYDIYNNKEIDRYFIRINDLFNKKFENGKLIRRDDINPTNIKRKILNIYVYVKNLEYYRERFKEKCLQDGKTFYKRTKKWRNFNYQISHAWERIKRIVRQISIITANIIIKIAFFHNISIIKMEDAEWSQTNLKNAYDKYLFFWYPYWLFSDIRKRVEIKCNQIGLQFKQVSALLSSIKCSRCGKMGNRDGYQFECPHCGFRLDADLNAARNIVLADK
ncbi:MAG: zinc ribbon domain-containing protein [Promethearchaeota archaeon]